MHTLIHARSNRHELDLYIHLYIHMYMYVRSYTHVHLHPDNVRSKPKFQFPYFLLGTAPFKSVLTVLLRHATRSQLSDLFQNIIRPALQRVSDLTNAPPDGGVGDRNSSTNSNSLNNSIYNNNSYPDIPYVTASLPPISVQESNIVEKLENVKNTGLSSRPPVKYPGSSSNSVIGTSHSRKHSHNNSNVLLRTNFPGSHNASKRNLLHAAIVQSITSSLSNTNTGNNTQQNTATNTQNNSTETSIHNSVTDSVTNSSPCSACPSISQTQKNSIDALEEGVFKDVTKEELRDEVEIPKSRKLSRTKNNGKPSIPPTTVAHIPYDQSIINDFFTEIPIDNLEFSEHDLMSRAVDILNAGNNNCK